MLKEIFSKSDMPSSSDSTQDTPGVSLGLSFPRNLYRELLLIGAMGQLV